MSKKSIFAESLLVSGIILLAACWFTYPLVVDMSSSFIAEKQGSDANQYSWNTAVFKENVLADQNPFETNKILIPERTNLLMHTYTPLMGVFGLFFSNAVLANNVFLLLHFLLAGLGAYMLARKVLKHRLAALLVAALFAFSPFRMFHLPQHYHLLLHGFAPWFILFFFRWQRQRTLPNLLLVVGLWLLNLGCDYYIAVFLGYFVALYVLWTWLLPAWKKTGKRRQISIIGFGLVFCHVLVSLLAGSVDSKAGFYWGGDLINLLLPNQNTWMLSRDFFVQRIPRMNLLLSSYEHQLYLGITTLFLLVGLAIISTIHWLQVRLSFWHLCSLVFLLIALPSVNFLGYRLFYPSTALAHFIPFFNNIRCPTRILSLVHLVLPLCCLQVLLPFITSRLSASRLNTGLLVLLVFQIIDLKPKMYNTLGIADVPDVIHHLTRSSAHTLLPIPTGVTDGMKSIGHFDVNHLYFQTLHHKALIGGYVSRLPANVFEAYQQDSVMSRLLCFSKTGQLPAAALAPSRITAFHQTFHPDVVIVQPAYHTLRLRAWLRVVFPTPVWHYKTMDRWLIVERL